MLALMRAVAVAALATSILGCAPQPFRGVTSMTPFDRGLEYLRSGKLEEAYRALEDPRLGRDTEVADLMRTRPELVEAGFRTFSPEALKASTARYGPDVAFSVETARLARFKLWADPDRYERAAAALSSETLTRNLQRAADTREREQVARMPAEEQARYLAAKLRRQREADGWITGVVISAQVSNESYINPGTGERLGSAAGQAVYWDSTSLRDYSSTAQLGAGVAGALVGSLLDRPTAFLFRTTYFVRTTGGDIKRYEGFSADGTHIPEGVCVAVRGLSEIEVVNQNECAGAAH